MSMSIGATQLGMIQSDSARIQSLKTQAAAAQTESQVDPRMQQAAEGFEALFLQKMLQAGRSASLGDDLMGSNGTKQMQSMLDQTLTENASGKAGLGLADAIVRQFGPMAMKATDK
ncbi:MAG: rod-binding protein [Thalassovita sp.]